MIADCPEPKDQKKIAKNRKEFQAKTAGYNGARWVLDIIVLGVFFGYRYIFILVS